MRLLWRSLRQEVVGATDALESIKTGVVGTRSDKGREE